MMFRGDQHVDDWVEVAVDYLDGRLDEDTRLAVESHLSGCPDCAARLREQESVVRFLQETPLYDAPEDLEYRAIGELIFPSPGGRPIAPPVEVEKRSRSPRWYRTLRAWIPATVAVVALLAAVVGYGIVRSGSGAELTATNSDKAAGSPTTMAASASTAAPATTMAAGLATTVTSAGATTTTALASAGPPASEQAPAVLEASQDRRTMIRAIEQAQEPAYLSFRAPVALAGTPDTSPTTAAPATTDTTAAAGSDTSAVTTTETTVAPGTETTGQAGEGSTVATLSIAQATNIVAQIEGFTGGLQPLDKSLWLDGPTFAVFLPRDDAEELVDLVRSIGASLGAVVRVEGQPPAEAKNSPASIFKHKDLFPVLAAARALQPATWGYDFTTSTLASDSGGRSGTAATTPDEAGTHVLLIIWIAE